jgi:hypothetical protein
MQTTVPQIVIFSGSQLVHFGKKFAIGSAQPKSPNDQRANWKN